MGKSSTRRSRAGSESKCWTVLLQRLKESRTRGPWPRWSSQSQARTACRLRVLISLTAADGHHLGGQVLDQKSHRSAGIEEGEAILYIALRACRRCQERREREQSRYPIHDRIGPDRPSGR